MAEALAAEGYRRHSGRRMIARSPPFCASIPPMPVHVYQYPKCSTCRKALAWLDEHGVEYSKSDLVTERIGLKSLEDLHRRSGLPVGRFFNTSGESYRAGNFKDRLAAMSEGDALRALAADGKLVKRPIVDAGAHVLVGFDAAAYSRQFG
jgi:arsenate reductase